MRARANSCISENVNRLIQKRRRQSETWEHMRRTANMRKEICSPRLYAEPNSLEEQLSNHAGDSVFVFVEPDFSGARTMNEALSQGDHSYNQKALRVVRPPVPIFSKREKPKGVKVLEKEHSVILEHPAGETAKHH